MSRSSLLAIYLIFTSVILISQLSVAQASTSCEIARSSCSEESALKDEYSIVPFAEGVMINCAFWENCANRYTCDYRIKDNRLNVYLVNSNEEAAGCECYHDYQVIIRGIKAGKYEVQFLRSDIKGEKASIKKRSSTNIPKAA